MHAVVSNGMVEVLCQSGSQQCLCFVGTKSGSVAMHLAKLPT